MGEGEGLVTDGAGVTADVPVAVGMGAGVGVWGPSESPESLASDPADSPVSASGPRKTAYARPPTWQASCITTTVPSRVIDGST